MCMSVYFYVLNVCWFFLVSKVVFCIVLIELNSFSELFFSWEMEIYRVDFFI